MLSTVNLIFCRFKIIISNFFGVEINGLIIIDPQLSEASETLEIVCNFKSCQIVCVSKS